MEKRGQYAAKRNGMESDKAMRRTEKAKNTLYEQYTRN